MLWEWRAALRVRRPGREEASVVRLSLIDALAQSRKPRLSGQVKFGLHGVKLHFYAPKPWPDVGRDLLAKILGADRRTDQQPTE